MGIYTFSRRKDLNQAKDEFVHYVRMCLNKDVFNENIEAIKSIRPSSREAFKLFLLYGCSFEKSIKLIDETFKYSFTSPLSEIQMAELMIKLSSNPLSE